MRDMQFLPPKKPSNPPEPSHQHQVLPSPLENTELKPPITSSKQSRISRFWVYVIASISVFFIALIAAGVWYVQAIEPVTSEPGEGVRVIVEEGDSVMSVAQKLKSAGLIKSILAFRIHGEITGQSGSIQTGGFIIHPNESVADIMKHMANSKSDEFDVTIIPGLTEWEIASKLRGAGFEDRVIEHALNKTYDHPLLAGRPSGASLEGYIFPETYRIAADGTPSDVLEKSFDEFWKYIEERNYRDGAKRQGLSLHEAITLASIIELEVTSRSDQKQVAQVFLKRLKEDMPLGSDPTFKYAAERDGVEPRVGYDSPYNTRVNKGIPPGPIANFKITALDAVINPASGDYLYFVSGDDGVTHFSKTLEEHEANIDKYCTTLCE